MSINIQSSAELSLFIKKLSAFSGVPQSPIGRALSSLCGAYSIAEYNDLLDNSLKQRVRDDIHRALCFLYDNNLSPEDVHQHVETIAPSTYPTLSALREALTNVTGDPALTKSLLPFEPGLPASPSQNTHQKTPLTTAPACYAEYHLFTRRLLKIRAVQH